MTMFLKLTYRRCSACPELPASTAWINMDRIISFTSYNSGSLLVMATKDDSLIIVDKSPEELMEMMDKIRNAGCYAVVHELASIRRSRQWPSRPGIA